MIGPRLVFLHFIPACSAGTLYFVWGGGVWGRRSRHEARKSLCGSVVCVSVGLWSPSSRMREGRSSGKGGSCSYWCGKNVWRCWEKSFVMTSFIVGDNISIIVDASASLDVRLDCYEQFISWSIGVGREHHKKPRATHCVPCRIFCIICICLPHPGTSAGRLSTTMRTSGMRVRI